ncbi:thioesterase II family protein [Streptomyces sp. XD-27]|uniref:thioesterase II family protein n=1 Tax=Streptomyces sp. XD-27 TaxID=3062779 RepID=UPI0026F45B27|nr:alpha/beta fold hydrolase [Streptomyces sp. XD-27]WKX74005.1 alpha/beta fold hydrolase [Streptomyces sp. XD-27]
MVLPHSGGGPNRYLRLVDGLPQDIEILGLTLPGRERRLAEPVGATLDDVLASLATLPRLDVPTVVFGHSLGAVLGLHVARALGEHCVGLIASGQVLREPDGCSPEDVEDESILRTLDLGGDLPREVFEDAAWRATLVGNMRADLRLDAEASRRGMGVRIEAPVTVLCGREDRLIDVDALGAWGRHSSAPCRVHLFPGGHFGLFDEANRALVTGAITEQLAAVPPLAAGRDL